MRVDEFLDRLYETPRLWCVDEHGEIRYRGAALLPCCPWSVVAESVPPADRTIKQGGDDVTGEVWRAADRLRDYNPRIRAALLAACGLEEKGA